MLLISAFGREIPGTAAVCRYITYRDTPSSRRRITHVARGRNGAAIKQLRTLFHLGTTRELTDGQLLERFATGGGETAELAFAALIERHGPMVLRVCRGILADTHDSQDAFQATFLVLVKKARGLWVRDSLGPWLHQVAYRTALCARLAAAHRRRHEQGAAILRTELQVERHDDLESVLHEEIERLPERFRSPLILCDLEGRSHEQVARHLGWPVGTVKSRQARGRERLRDRLRRRGLALDSGVFVAALRFDELSAPVSPALVTSTIQSAVQLVSSSVFVPGFAASLAQGVLNSMNFGRWLKVASVFLFLGATSSGVGLLAQKATQFTLPPAGGNLQIAQTEESLTMRVKPGKFIVAVAERGRLEAAHAEDAYCMVEGQTTIISILPERSAVKKGQLVCQLDSASHKDRLVNQQIVAKATATAHENAKLTREVAELAVLSYEDGTLPLERAALNGAISVAQSAMDKAELRLGRTRNARKRLNDILAAKGGSVSPTEIVAAIDIEDRLEDAEQTLLKERLATKLAKTQRDLLEKYTSGRTTSELKIDVGRKRSEEFAKKATWQLETSKCKKLENQIAQCNIKAPADGILVYANDPNRLTGRTPQIEEGVTVRERQKIFTVVDRDGPLRVITKIQESQIDKIRSKLKARIRVDAFPHQVLEGTVSLVSPLPDSARLTSDKKTYTTWVELEKIQPDLRPGLTAQVEILVSDLDNVLSVPVEAIVRYDNKDHVAIKKSDGGHEWREVALGQSNDRFVEVKQGIKSEEVVVIKPLPLLGEEQKRMMINSPTAPAARPNAPQ
jgi:HlyD family secretion protein